MEHWTVDTEYTDEIVTAVKPESNGYAVETDGAWLFWNSAFGPQVGDTARYFGKGFGYPVRGVVCLPKGGGAPVVVRYQSPDEHNAERKRQSEEYQREFDARPKRPRVEFGGRVYDSEMGEISGFGGGYEEMCRKMALAGMQWLDEHPDANPRFMGNSAVYGVISEDNEDAKALTEAILAPSDGGASGAMHQACVSHALAYKRLGWDAYRAKMMDITYLTWESLCRRRGKSARLGVWRVSYSPLRWRQGRRQSPCGRIDSQ